MVQYRSVPNRANSSTFRSTALRRLQIPFPAPTNKIKAGRRLACRGEIAPIQGLVTEAPPIPPSVVAASLMIQNFSNAQRDVAYGPSLPRRPSAFVSVIRCLAAALGRWPARQLMTHFDSLPTTICCRAVAFACTGAGQWRLLAPEQCIFLSSKRTARLGSSCHRRCRTPSVGSHHAVGGQHSSKFLTRPIGANCEWVANVNAANFDRATRAPASRART